MKVGERLAELRNKKGITQNELAKLTNISRSRIGLYETNKRDPDLDTIKYFAEFFNVSTDYLLGKSEFKQTHGFRISSEGKKNITNTVINGMFDAINEVMVKVPIIGKIPAGTPCIALQEYDEFEQVPRSWLNGHPEEYFILKVNGDSMEGARIFDGDNALMVKESNFDNGQICAVGIMGDYYEPYATLKRVYDFDSIYIELVPENPKYPRFKVKREDVTIYGRLKKIIRNF